jgi:hypothetical protein
MDEVATCRSAHSGKGGLVQGKSCRG